MAPELANEKASTARITTTQYASDDKSALTPLTTENLAVSPDDNYGRISDVSTPVSSHMGLNPFDTDVEAMMASTLTTREDDSCGMKSVSNTKSSPDGQVWPGKGHWKQKAKANKVNQRSCQCLAKMSKRNRMITKVALILLVIAIAVGVGFGISKPLGAGIWKGD